MSQVAELNRRLAIADILAFEELPGAFAVAHITTRYATASIALQGAHVMSYQPAGHAPLIWLSKLAKFALGKSIRGGVPVCWPWFGAHPSNAQFPGHGFARTVPWQLVGAQDILGLMTKRDELQRKIRDLKNRYARIEGVDRDGTLAKLNAQLVTVSNTLDQKMKESGDAERQLTALSANINQERAVYQREHEKFLNANPVKSVVAKAQRVVNLIHDLIPQLYSLKIKHLGEAMTEVYKRLAHKKHVDKIDIDENGTARVLSHEGDEIVFDKSAGENQVFATALLAGLAKISGLEAPLIVDTPLGRLDSSHRNNILKYWVSDKNRQVILLSQDKEIDRATYGSMQGAVAKTYLLQHQEIGNGVGKTTAVENAYFQEIPA
ncbi:MAG: hypothetical protein NTW45_03940 [Rhodocyclales bacterium]|nr:hypothetical protein [Rhodocyclales bacterium]